MPDFDKSFELWATPYIYPNINDTWIFQIKAYKEESSNLSEIMVDNQL